MILTPPILRQESVSSQSPSTKHVMPRPKSKESSLKNKIQDFDHLSVASNESKGAKVIKKKESFLNKVPNQPFYGDLQLGQSKNTQQKNVKEFSQSNIKNQIYNDGGSVKSGASKNSHQGKVKESSLNKIKNANLSFKQNKIIQNSYGLQNSGTSFKNYLQNIKLSQIQMSPIQKYLIKSPRVLQYQQPLKDNTSEILSQKVINMDSQDQKQIIKVQGNKVPLKREQKVQEASRLNNTSSTLNGVRRMDVFGRLRGNDTISKISNEGSRMSSEERPKSRTKLGHLFKQERQRHSIEASEKVLLFQNPLKSKNADDQKQVKKQVKKEVKEQATKQGVTFLNSIPVVSSIAVDCVSRKPTVGAALMQVAPNMHDTMEESALNLSESQNGFFEREQKGKNSIAFAFEQENKHKGLTVTMGKRGDNPILQKLRKNQQFIRNSGVMDQPKYVREQIVKKINKKTNSEIKNQENIVSVQKEQKIKNAQQNRIKEEEQEKKRKIRYQKEKKIREEIQKHDEQLRKKKIQQEKILKKKNIQQQRLKILNQRLIQQQIDKYQKQLEQKERKEYKNRRQIILEQQKIKNQQKVQQQALFPQNYQHNKCNNRNQSRELEWKLKIESKPVQSKYENNTNHVQINQMQQRKNNHFNNHNKSDENKSLDSYRSGRSDSGSQKSKGKKKQSTIQISKKNVIKLKPSQAPYTEQSFYQNQKRKQDKNISNGLFTFDSQQQRVKSKTDINFYDFSNSQKNLKVPSAKPPLSQKSSSSKAKESSLKIHNDSKGKGHKKISLLQKALAKQYDDGSDDGSNSQASFKSGSSHRSSKKESSLSKREDSLDNRSRNSRREMAEDVLYRTDTYDQSSYSNTAKRSEINRSYGEKIEKPYVANINVLKEFLKPVQGQYYVKEGGQPSSWRPDHQYANQIVGQKPKKTMPRLEKSRKKR